MSETVLIRMTKKFNKYNVGERISVAPHIADQWCGAVNPMFCVAVRVPDDEVEQFKQEIAPVDKMVRMSDVSKSEEAPRRPGRPPKSSD